MPASVFRSLEVRAGAMLAASPLPHPLLGQGERTEFILAMQLGSRIGGPLTRHRTVGRSVCGGRGLVRYTRRGRFNHRSGGRRLSRRGRSGAQGWPFEAAAADNGRAQSKCDNKSK